MNITIKTRNILEEIEKTKGRICHPLDEGEVYYTVTRACTIEEVTWTNSEEDFDNLRGGNMYFSELYASRRIIRRLNDRIDELLGLESKI